MQKMSEELYSAARNVPGAMVTRSLSVTTQAPGWSDATNCKVNNLSGGNYTERSSHFILITHFNSPDWAYVM